MSAPLILISGLPRSGKTTLAEALAGEDYTHVPLDRYIRPMPPGITFLEWVADPSCIAWDPLEADLKAVTPVRSGLRHRIGSGGGGRAASSGFSRPAVSA